MSHRQPADRPLAVTAAILSLVALLGACGADSTPPPDSPPSVAAEETAPSADGVAYEPAYPTEVSDEGLSGQDVTQQETTHSHGGEEHTHDDEGGHGDEGDHGHPH